MDTTTMTMATVISMIYSGICIITVMGVVAWMIKKKKSKALIITLALGIVLSTYFVPLYIESIVIEGTAKIIMGTMFGLTVSFVPVITVDLAVLLSKKEHSENTTDNK